MNQELVRYIEAEIIPRYEHFDKAHQVGHVRTVIEQSLQLAEHYDVDPDMVYAVAAYHDTGLVEGRETHHTVSARIIREDPRLRQTMVVFLSALGDEEQQLTGFDVGADDYLTKPIKMKLLVSRIQALVKRVPAEPARPEPGAAAERPELELDEARHTVRCGEKWISLPRKEFALLKLFWASPGELIPRETIYSRIWGTQVIVGDRTIDVHIRKLRQKIGEQRIVTVKGIGYRFEP